MKSDSDSGLTKVFMNRTRVVYFGPRLIVDVLNWAASPAGTELVIPKNAGLPTDATVLDIWMDNSRRAFGCQVCHESFDEVESGAEAPGHCAGVQLEWRTVKKRDLKAEDVTRYIESIERPDSFEPPLTEELWSLLCDLVSLHLSAFVELVAIEEPEPSEEPSMVDVADYFDDLRVPLAEGGERNLVAIHLAGFIGHLAAKNMEILRQQAKKSS